jgi:hypothetical protein
MRTHPFLALTAALTSSALAQPAQLLKLVPDQPVAFTQVGTGVALSPTLAAVAGTGTFTLQVPGKAFLFDPATGAQLAELPVPGVPAERVILGDIALGNGFVAVGRRIDNVPEYTNSVQVFTTADPTNPVLITSIAPDDADNADAFGEAIAISGDLMLVGAYGDDPLGGLSGSAYLFDMSDPANPAQTAKITASDGDDVDTFGRAVDIDATTAIVGSRWDDDDGNRSGSAYLFDVSDPANPIETAKITALDAQADDFFGFSVAVSGDLAVVGAIFEDQAGLAAGAAYVFDISDPHNPTQTAKITAPDASDNDDLGWSVAIEGTIALISARVAPGVVNNAGAAYLYDLTDPASPAFLAKLQAADGDANDIFGSAVAISGDRALIGSSADDVPEDAAGSAYLFDISTAPTPCNPADLAEPFGSLTFADIGAFLNAFTTSDPAADLAAPTGQFTFADIGAFLGAFNAGCP